MQLTKLFKEFFDSGKAGGVILLLATVMSVVLANSQWSDAYTGFWQIEFQGHSLVHLTNDGLMTIFFLLIGLELEREIYIGELSNVKNALLPIFGALGGMLLPAAIFLAFNYGTSTQAGFGIPMATDIAFAVGILSILGNRIPSSLKIFLTALAVIDDLGAIIIIALFYTSSLVFTDLFIALGIMGFLFILNRLKVYNLIPYLVGGVAMWYFMLGSGVHATITGVLLAFVIPFGDGGERSPSHILQHFLHKPVSLFILPLFAIANTCIVLGSDWLDGLVHVSSLGIISGLVIGKPIGILIFSMISARLGLSALPPDLKWSNITGAGFLAGIGFTMSIFITLLAFDNEQSITSSKIAILVASIISGTIGYVWLKVNRYNFSGL
jgi:NhaA family Na+:H+ antiporter